MRKFFMPSLFAFLGILCFGVFHSIGGRLDSSGFLHEPFALLPIGYLFLLASVFWIIILALKRVKNKIRKVKHE